VIFIALSQNPDFSEAKITKIWRGADSDVEERRNNDINVCMHLER
jgi:hypothetical protein